MLKDNNIITNALVLSRRIFDNDTIKSSMGKYKVQDICSIKMNNLRCISSQRPRVIAYSTSKVVYIVFRGTSAKDKLHNVQANLRFFQSKNKETQIHSGFLTLFTNIEQDLKKYLKSVGNKKIVFCGASMGAALSLIAVYKLSGDIVPKKNVYNVTFGLPPTGNDEFINMYNSSIQKNKHIHYLLKNDPVSMLSYTTLNLKTPAKFLGYAYINKENIKILIPEHSKIIHHSILEYVYEILGDLNIYYMKIMKMKLMYLVRNSN